MAVEAFDCHRAIGITVQFSWAQTLRPCFRIKTLSITVDASALAGQGLGQWLQWLLWTPIGELLSQLVYGVLFLTLSPWLGVCSGMPAQPIILPAFAFPLSHPCTELNQDVGIPCSLPGLVLA